MKQIRRGPMSPCALRKMIQKFETTGDLGIFPGRRRKQIPSSSVEDVATAVVEASSQSPHDSVSVPVVSRVLDMPYCTVRKNFTPDFEFVSQQNLACTYCRTGTHRFVQLLHFARMVVDVTCPWNILWSEEDHFCLNGHVNTHSCRIWAAKKSSRYPGTTLAS
ncbi:hypothetical protein AVEN_136095-1 [Araneus ventricosus]|uniref:DUF4817 domain-containing protein n=1 Tax=Araneus ventricosus TaxID=182803 RepID=A0A4Y2LFV2_ARAVE|nr:hypothetical protein AVEN_136095-1 [Araneus ventricosus]